MTQQVFLEKLQVQLRKKFPENRVEEILNDYREYFEDGLAEGQTEEALCEQFGLPKDIVSELCSQGVQTKNDLLHTGIKWVNWLLLCILLSSSFWGRYWILQNNDIFLSCIVFLPVLQLFFKKQIPSQNIQSLGKYRISALAGCSFLGLLILAAEVFTLWNFALTKAFWFSLPPDNIGPFFALLFGIGNLFALIGWGLAVLWNLQKLGWYLFLQAGIAATLQRIFLWTSMISDDDVIIIVLKQNLSSLWIGLAIAIGILIWQKGRKQQ